MLKVTLLYGCFSISSNSRMISKEFVFLKMVFTNAWYHHWFWKLTSHGIFHYLYPADLSKSFSELIMPIFFSVDFLRGYHTLLISWFVDLNPFLSNIPFWAPWKHQKTFGFLMFSGGSKRNIGKKWISCLPTGFVCCSRILCIRISVACGCLPVGVFYL